MPEETRQKISQNRRGILHSDEAKEKMSKTWIQKGQRFSPNTEFKDGHIPWNKGKKGIMKPPPHAFKKGHIPKHKLPDEIRVKIREDLRPSRAIAKDYGINKSTVLRIKKESY